MLPFNISGFLRLLHDNTEFIGIKYLDKSGIWLTGYHILFINIFLTEVPEKLCVDVIV